MAFAWEYSRGTWTRITDPMSDFGDGDLTVLAAQLGFATDDSESLFGEEGEEFAFTVYRAKEQGAGPYDYFLCIDIGIGDVEMVYLPDFPSYFMLAKELVPLVQMIRTLRKEETS